MFVQTTLLFTLNLFLLSFLPISLKFQSAAMTNHLLVRLFALFGFTTTIATPPPQTISGGTATISLASFQSTSPQPPSSSWYELDDPVMGGRSSGSFSIKNDLGVFTGSVVNVPFLHAPGFIQVNSAGPFPNIESCAGGGLMITCRSLTDYDGYKLSFGSSRGRHCGYPEHSRGFKTKLNVQKTDEFVQVKLPFEEFSNCNSDFTGLPIRSCNDDPKVCVDDDTLKDMKPLTIWGEGVAGDLNLEIKEIVAYGCSSGDEEEEEEAPVGDEARLNVDDGSDVSLVTFDSAHPWNELNDPVMGGKSTGSFEVVDGTGVFKGEVVNVPFLQAPGFIQASISDSNFPSVDHCSSLTIECRSLTQYDGYKISFGTSRNRECSYYSRGFKTSLDVKSGNDFQKIVIPFSDFSNCNDDATGLPKKTCSEDSKVCPDEGTLKSLDMITVWGEGVVGDVDLEMKSIKGTECGSVVQRVEKEGGLRHM